MIEIEIRMIDKCNLSCKHCYAMARHINRTHFTVSKNYLYTREHIKKFLEKIRDFIFFCFERQGISGSLPFVVVSLMGGEPLLVGIELYDTFVSLIKKIVGRDVNLHITTSTNAILLDEKWAFYFKERQDLVRLAVAYDPEIRFSNKSEEERWEKSIELLNTLGVEFTLNVALTSRLLGFPLWDFVKKHCIRLVDIAPFLPVGRGRINKELGLCMSELVFLIIKLLQEKPEDVVLDSFSSIPSLLKKFKEKRNEEYFMNGWGPCWRKMIVDLEGNIYLECSYPISVGNIFRNPWEVFYSPFLISFYKKKFFRSSCMECEFYNFCLGGCIALTIYEDTECRGMKTLLKYFLTKTL